MQMIEREVTDLLQVSLSIMLASVYIFSIDNSVSEFPIVIYSMISIALLAFIHTILTQLKMISSEKSKLIAIFSLALLIPGLIGLVQDRPEDWGSFWQKLNLKVEFVLISIYSILTIIVLISLKASTSALITPNGKKTEETKS